MFLLAKSSNISKQNGRCPTWASKKQLQKLPFLELQSEFNVYGQNTNSLNRRTKLQATNYTEEVFYCYQHCLFETIKDLHQVVTIWNKSCEEDQEDIIDLKQFPPKGEELNSSMVPTIYPNHPRKTIIKTRLHEPTLENKSWMTHDDHDVKLKRRQFIQVAELVNHHLQCYLGATSTLQKGASWRPTKVQKKTTKIKQNK